jgi:hypothetical protein
MTIDEIFLCKKISIRTRNICKYNGLNDLQSIINYYRNKSTFLNLRNCGRKSNEELILLCEDSIKLEVSQEDICIEQNDLILNSTYYSIIDEIQKNTETDLKNTKIYLEFINTKKAIVNENNLYPSILSAFNSLSFASRTGVTNYLNGDLSIKNIIKKIVLIPEIKLSKIRKKNFGEVIDFFEKVKILVNPNHHEVKSKKELETDFNNIDLNLSSLQFKIVDQYINTNLNYLSSISRNSISRFLNSNISAQNFIDKILKNKRFHFSKIQNVGAKSEKELLSFIKKVKVLILNIIDKEFQSIFKLAYFGIEHNKIFKKKDNIIFQKSLKIFDNQNELTLDELAEQLNITRERVRQIRKNIIENLFTYFEYIKYIEDDLYQKYNIDQNQHLINFDYDLINKHNKTNFSNEFITFIIYTYISDKFDLIGEIEDVLLPNSINSRERHNWRGCYIINQDLTKIFDFNNFMKDLNERLNERIEETYSFPFNSYLSNFMKEYDNTQITLLQPVVEKIINEEFDIFIDFNENIVFERNTVKQVHEYAIEVLEKLGVPSNIEEIFNYIEKDFPEITKSKEALRGSLQRTSEIIYFGRSSTYGLKKWENEEDGIKGGTIRSIVIKFLELESEPIHISKITKHVLKYRPDSNQKSIYYNLKMDESNSFIFFKESYVGLIQKNYDKAYEFISIDERIEKKSWKERYSELTNFLNKNSRLPFSSGCSKNEIKLYRWYQVQLGKSRKGDLDSEKSTLIKDIFDKSEQNSIRKLRTNVTDKYNKLKIFVIEQKRLPSANKTGEENLYQFFYKQRKLFELGELEHSEENKFIEIARIIQNHKYENKRD